MDKGSSIQSGLIHQAADDLRDLRSGLIPQSVDGLRDLQKRVEEIEEWIRVKELQCENEDYEKAEREEPGG